MGGTVDNPKLGLLNKLNRNQSALASFVLLKGVRVAQVLAQTGLAAVVIDSEHGTEGTTVKGALDTGAHGIIVPMISTAEEARSMVSCAKFPPVGVRGQGSDFAYREHGYASQVEYIARANDTILTMVQIETAAGVQIVEEICQVDGVDLLFIGPKDLALALLGYAPAEWTGSVFLEDVDEVVSTARKYRKKVGITAADGELARKMLERFDRVLMSGDVKSLQAWYSRELEIARA